MVKSVEFLLCKHEDLISVSQHPCLQNKTTTRQSVAVCTYNPSIWWQRQGGEQWSKILDVDFLPLHISTHMCTCNCIYMKNM